MYKFSNFESLCVQVELRELYSQHLARGSYLQDKMTTEDYCGQWNRAFQHDVENRAGGDTCGDGYSCAVLTTAADVCYFPSHIKNCIHA